jgi:signal peptidase I
VVSQVARKGQHLGSKIQRLEPSGSNHCEVLIFETPLHADRVQPASIPGNLEWMQMQSESGDISTSQVAADSGSSQSAAGTGPARRSKSMGFTLWLRDLLISATASVLIITFLYQPVRVEGTSMLPRLEDRDRLFINKFVYHVSAIERGDVVVFRHPASYDPQRSYIKRVIALPGDTLHIDHGRVYVNGKLLHEPYVPLEYRDDQSVAEMIIPAGSYYMMGDHRSISQDSRYFGPVERSLIYGKAVFVYWPARDVGVVH